ncbi:hypothetical protein T4B_9711 [Trichinella pseudospiralis]|uniref:Uncharacterized protein n=1 Tax=Trichinella pseudospiralis TaxID=6337 RepID=A0A0V1JFX3_TRIPS|nr:hypothetical protein T4B_9711 [Trichinella pseudospiralis]
MHKKNLKQSSSHRYLISNLKLIFCACVVIAFKTDLRRRKARQAKQRTGLTRTKMINLHFLTCDFYML